LEQNSHLKLGSKYASFVDKITRRLFSKTHYFNCFVVNDD